jgi:endonuclease/exonuclease/phosphatase family metal-dependent hydrolase
MRILRYPFYLIGLLAAGFVGLLVYGTLTDYQPPELEAAISSEKTGAQGPVDSVFQVSIWNIGYAGLGAGESFFLDGGEHVRPDRETYDGHWEGIQTYVGGLSSSDFILLQEVDRDSKRSYGTDQVAELGKKHPTYHWDFGLNFNVNFIPVPFDPFPMARPMGRVYGGLQSLSKYQPTAANRQDFPGSYSWPKRIYMLDRCFLEQRFPAPGGKELVMINTHNSAYDDGTMRSEEMARLKEFVEAEYEQGNFVFVGGDWNQAPADFDPNHFGEDQDEEDPFVQPNIEADYLADWTWAYDINVPTNRKVGKPYEAGVTYTPIIDFFLMSPNLEVLEVWGDDLQFAYSDHQPVHCKVRFK